MASCKREFERFVVWLHQSDVQAPLDVKRLANLILHCFDDLAETSRQHNQRSTFLVDQIHPFLDGITDAPPAIGAAAADNRWTWKRLRNLTLGPFRGFRTPETFDLTKRITLFFGLNGSAKSSLCEGLEYAMLDEVEEASCRRINIETYLTNIHTGRFDPPVLTASDNENREVAVEANPENYRFCFIEKNRIDAFSRISARPTGQRTELIATLFGMDSFNDFVSHFNESLDQQLVLVDTKQTTLTNLRTALELDQTAVSNEAVSLTNLANEESALAKKYAPDMTYVGLKKLIGTTAEPGRLVELNQLLNDVPPVVIGLTREGFAATYEAVSIGRLTVGRIVAALEARSDDVSFKELYTAVLALRGSQSDHCPACDTPLEGESHVLRDPYEKADAGLKELGELSQLQNDRDVAREELAASLRELRRQLALIATFIRTQDGSEAAAYLSKAATDATQDPWKALQASEEVDAVTLDEALSIVDRMAAQDAASESSHQERARNIEERDRLNEFHLLVQAQESKRKQLVDGLVQARGRITDFDTKNAGLIEKVAQEAKDIARDAPIKAAYDRFLAMLKDYRSRLPGTLLAGLNESAMNLYNDFNRNDRENDKLAALYLPLTGEQKIEVAFRGNPELRVDALHILSEGHVRCLGLAILLAKYLSIQSPVLIFDDVINAIDHEHRSSIRAALFEGHQFTQTQMILTCHSNEFIKDIQQQLTATDRTDCQVYLLRSHDGDYQPRVTSNLPSENYVEKARASRDMLNDREALTSSRKALEMFSEKTWRWLGKHGLGLISLPLAGVGAEPILRNLCEALLKQLKKAETFTHSNKALLIAAYERLLGIPANNLIWTYLNGGIHEQADREDFDGDVVELVVQTLEELDRLNWGSAR